MTNFVYGVKTLLRDARANRPNSLSTCCLVYKVLMLNLEESGMSDMSDKLREFVSETVDEILASLPAKELRKRLSAKERLQGLSAEEILRALSPKARGALARQLKAKNSAK